MVMREVFQGPYFFVFFLIPFDPVAPKSSTFTMFYTVLPCSNMRERDIYILHNMNLEGAALDGTSHRNGAAP